MRKIGTQIHIHICHRAFRHVSVSNLKMNRAAELLGVWTSRDSVLDFWWDSHWLLVSGGSLGLSHWLLASGENLGLSSRATHSALTVIA